MGEIDHFTYGAVTPVLAYALSVLGSLLGLSCTAKARAAAGAGRRTWYLLLAAWAIGGTGIWAMHFMAMLGFGVAGAEIRYDVPLTAASALLAVAVVAAGLFIVGFGRVHPLKIIIAGTLAGLGVAGMHYTGMAAMHLNGTVAYDPLLRAASVVIAVVAATVALWFTVTLRRATAIALAALLMGAAVNGMHFTGMFAMSVHLHGGADPQTGAPVFTLILPILLLVLVVIVALISALLAAPNDQDRSTRAVLSTALAGASAVPAPVPVADRDPHSTSLAEASRSTPTPSRQLAGGSFAGVRRSLLSRQVAGDAAPPPPPAAPAARPPDPASRQ